MIKKQACSAIVVGIVVLAGAAAMAAEKAKASKGKVTAKAVGIRTFLKAHIRGKAEQYKGFVVKGTGRNFRGDTKVIHPDGREEVFFTLSVFVLKRDGTLKRIRSLKDHIRAPLKNEPVLRVEVRGKGLKPNLSWEKRIRFSGRFEGEYSSVNKDIIFGPDPRPRPAKFKVPVLQDCTVTLR